MSSTSWWWLVVLWGGVAGVIGAAVGIWVVTRRSRETSVASNVLRLPPCADRSGPTHVVTVPRIFDFDREPA